MPNSAATTAARKRIAHTASAAVLAAAAIATVIALTFPTYSWGANGNAGENASTVSPIKLVQLERNANGSALEQLTLESDFLLPAVGGANIEDANNLDAWGMPKTDAFVDMIVGAANCSRGDEPGANEAAGHEAANPTGKTLYTRVLVAVPAALETLDNPATIDIDESESSPLHLVDGSRFAYSEVLDNGQKVADNKVTDPALWPSLWTHEVNPGGSIEIDGVTYNVHVFTYKVPLEPGKTTQLPAIVGFYLDPNVDYDHATQCLTYNGTSTKLALLTGDLGIPVSAQASDNENGLGTMTTNPWSANSGIRGLLERLFKTLSIG